MTQAQALSILKTGKNVFITGPAGSGKTHVVNEYIKFLKDHNVAVGITASTGIAATHLGGTTIHSWSGMGVRANMSDKDIETLFEKKYIVKRIQSTEVLIIDEVSMLHHFRLDMLDKILRLIRGRNDTGDIFESRNKIKPQTLSASEIRKLPFGGIQIVLCGDFFQLPPIARFDEPEAHFIYKADSWKGADFTVCYLSEQFRQKDDEALSILNEIRSGNISQNSREHLKKRFNLRTIENIEPTQLFTHNIDVDVVNDRQLDLLEGDEFEYEMTSKGKLPIVEILKKSCLAPEILRLKKGARVMCVKNNFEQGYVNGTLGVVFSCGFGVDPVIRTSRGELITIEPAKWSIDDDGRVLAEITQYPLRLAWAITVHKSQGMSLDAVEVDLSKSFEPGMGYVALSRVRTLNGLTILGLNELALKVHGGVLEYDSELRKSSGRAESILTYTDGGDIVRSQEEFLARVAPLHAMKKKDRKGRSVKVSTFDKTALLVVAQKSIQDMTTERGLTAETIISHIEELIRLGQKIDITYLRDEISSSKFEKIKKAFREVFEETGQTFLSPVKTKTGPNISFLEIRLARVLLGYVEKVSDE